MVLIFLQQVRLLFITRKATTGIRMAPKLQRLLTLVGITAFLFILLLYIGSWEEFLARYKQDGHVTIRNSIPLDSRDYNIPPLIFETIDNETGVEDFVVPNIVHFLRFQSPTFSFVHAVTVLAAFRNQRPDKIMFHTDVDNFNGHYWEKIKNTSGLVYEIVKVTLPMTIYGQKFSKGWHLWHAGDVTRIRILMKYGGIFLDNDAYIVQNLDLFRKFEMAVGWDENQCLGTQVLVANKNARFLPLWLNSYRQYYPDKWYYNAGCKPTEEILYKKPELVHRVKLLFGVHMLVDELYKTYWPDWRKQYAIHLLINHRSYLDKEHLNKWKEFDEKNILYYNYTFGEMAREAYGIS